MASNKLTFFMGVVLGVILLIILTAIIFMPISQNFKVMLYVLGMVVLVATQLYVYRLSKPEGILSFFDAKQWLSASQRFRKFSVLCCGISMPTLIGVALYVLWVKI